MATLAHRMIQDQNLNILNTGGIPGEKSDVAKADKRRGLVGRKALNDISNSRKPSVLHPVKKDHSVNIISIEKDPCAVKTKLSKVQDEKGKVGGGRKAHSDLTNSVKPPLKQVPRTVRKLNALAESNVPSCIMGESFLHNHQECIKAQMKIVDEEYFLKSVGLSNDIAILPSPKRALPSSSKKHGSYLKHLDMEEMPEEHMFEDQLLCCLSACRSPPSRKAATPYMSWDDGDFSDLKLIESPI